MGKLLDKIHQATKDFNLSLDNLSRLEFKLRS